jgi:starvation-inducible DNA-binding protein
MAEFSYTVPGISIEEGKKVAEILQARLNSMNDLHLTLKHAHWNVTGRNFIAVHEMLDPQVELVRGYADEIAERIAALGGSPIGVPGRLSYQRPWDDYSVDKAPVVEHLKALDKVYDGVVKSHRDAVEETSKLDPMTEDMLTGQTRELEQFQWFLRAHLEGEAAS